MSEIVIDKEKCVKCGLCASDCLTYCIDLVDDGYPQIIEGSHCIQCQHCLSICPTGALSFDDKKPENSSPIKYDNILDLIKSRRSIRQYKEEEISEEEMTKIKEILPYIPTGCNSHALHFSIVEKRTVMDDLRKRVNSLLLKAIFSKYSPLAKKFGKYKDALQNGEDIIFRNAPHMIVVSSPLTAPCANVDPIIALSYMELYAQSLGLGTCWCGFAEICIKMFPEISEILDIPNGYKPVYAMLLGYPKVKYARTPQPEPYKISEIKEVKTNNSCIFCKTKRFITNFLR